ncbi:MAG: hypothetical protein IPP61_11865 [Cytophagaceae bacterium]|nr:hypothetical protein [Cytophagaceae bacterium]
MEKFTKYNNYLKVHILNILSNSDNKNIIDITETDKMSFGNMLVGGYRKITRTRQSNLDNKIKNHKKMKRQIFTLLLIFTFISNLVSAQDEKDWGEWRVTKCFKGIQFRTRPMGTEPGKYGYSRYIQFRNNYNTKVAFGYTVKGFQKEHDEYVRMNGSQYRTELKANSTDDGLMWFSSTNANGQYISLGYLRFLGADETDASKTYEGCDDKTAISCNSCTYKPTYWCSNYDKSKDKSRA